MEESNGDELFRHIKKNLAKGYRENAIKWALVNQGYSKAAVERALRRAIKSLEDEKQKSEDEKQKSERPKITYSLYDDKNRVVYGKEPFWKKFFRKY